ncbi:Thioredoxin reductase [hydrothermal vent metagenome]|uniref:Thioredoxin reductase n=1 Tax=hydrothermal vent metagenome TaxID=652676 RepID=A0A3B1BRJ9_9ZZZZ
MYDCVIIGGGPGGITAAIYAIRSGMKTVIVEKLGVGGQIAMSDIIENYPGFPSISGMELMKHFEEHAKSIDAEIKNADVTSIELNGDTKIVHTTTGDIEAKAVIVVTGAEPKKLGFKGEGAFTGRGISTCATCDGPFYRNKPIALIGGGDTAVKESIYLSKIASKVYHIHRRDRFRAESILRERINSKDNIEFLWNHTTEEALGNESGVTGIRVKSLETGETKEIEVDGIFVFVGITPNTGFIDCEKDDQGFIVVNQNMETSIPGVYAAGDCRVTPLRQVVTAVGDSAIAAFKAEEYVSEMEGNSYNKNFSAK